MGKCSKTSLVSLPSRQIGVSRRARNQGLPKVPVNSETRTFS